MDATGYTGPEADIVLIDYTASGVCNGTFNTVNLIGRVDSIAYGTVVTNKLTVHVIPAGNEHAWIPLPSDGSIDVPLDVQLSWMSGESADMHDVYFGTSFEDVNFAMPTDIDGDGWTALGDLQMLSSDWLTGAAGSDISGDGIIDFIDFAMLAVEYGTSSVYKGRQSSNSYPSTGTMAVEENVTYYWRIDEVDTDTGTIYKGDVWWFNPLNLIDIDVVYLQTPLTGYSTFQSHNQKVVANDNGIFLTFIYSTPSDAPSIWRLARSTDGGQTFSIIYESSDYTRAPAMETDENNNIYLTFPVDGATKFLRFTSANGYTSPDINRTHSGVTSASKYAMAFDKTRQQFYHATQWQRVLTFDMAGNLLRNQQVWGSSPISGTQYPHLFVDSAGVLHHAMTTLDSADNYETIRHLKSIDGGATWKAMDGTAISIPTSPEPTGPSTMINLPDEITLTTWLGTMHVKDGKLHFVYRTVNVNPNRQHYMRFNGQTGAREIDSWTDWGNWQGMSITMRAESALLASDPQDPSGPLYAVGEDSNGNLSALISFDNGSTWQDYATSSIVFSDIYAVGGFRELTPDGKVIGSFSGKIGSTWRTYYFQFPSYSEGD